MKHKEKLAGVYAPVVTPFQDDDLQLEWLRFNLAHLRGTSLRGYLALGSNGEFRSLTTAEQFQVLEVFAEEKGDKIIMVGTGCESSRETIEKSRAVAGMGFDYLSVLTPGYFAKMMTGPVLRDYYLRIADAVELPLLLYNAPGFTGGVEIPASVLAELSKHPNIAGIKDSSKVGPAGFFNHLDPKDDFAVLAGSTNFYYPSLHLGAVGGILSLGNILPDPCSEVYQLWKKGDYDRARQLHFKLARLNGAISGIYGVAGVKAAMEVMGYKGGQPRHPLQPLTGEQRTQIKNVIIEEGFEVEL